MARKSASAVGIAGVAEAAGQLGIANEHSVLRGPRLTWASTNMSAGSPCSATAGPLRKCLSLSLTSWVPPLALGNNLADRRDRQMGLRLAGAGKQVSMTEAEILSLASTLGSVGIGSSR